MKKKDAQYAGFNQARIKKRAKHSKKQVSLDLRSQISKGSGQDADSNPTFGAVKMLNR